jgi:hypothetical protein
LTWQRLSGRAVCHVDLLLLLIFVGVNLPNNLWLWLTIIRNKWPHLRLILPLLICCVNHLTHNTFDGPTCLNTQGAGMDQHFLRGLCHLLAANKSVADNFGRPGSYGCP